MGVETCINCSERYLGCHDHCDKYLTALNEFRSAKAKELNERNITATVNGLHLRRISTKKR